MSTSDGVNKKEKTLSNSEVAVANRRRSIETDQNPSLEKFRGFKKVPQVLLPRYDITPYLKKLNKLSKSVQTDVKCNVVTSVHLNRLAQKCVVQLLKDDLGKLKEGILRRRERQASTDSDTDGEIDSMSNIKCKICEKGYANEKKLLKHQQKKHIVYKPNNKTPKRVSFSDHVIVHEVTEYHKCRKCPKIFEAYKFLKTHMRQHHKKRKCYICNYCHKKFVDRTFFKVHIRLHCDVCGVLFPSKLKYLEHRRTECQTVKPKSYKCKTCDESYFRFMDLKDHSYEHIFTCYVCDVCKDTFQTKCAVTHHVSFLHSQRRPTTLYAMRTLGNERLYLCNFCEESSVEREGIESHVAVLPDLTNRAMTGYKDYYFCDQCMAKFDTETDMLQHKWSHFLKTSGTPILKDRLLSKKGLKTTYKYGDVIPEYMQPRVVLERLNIDGKVLSERVEFVNAKNIDVNSGKIKTPIVDPKSKKTIISKHQCMTCGKYYSSSYCLSRHIETQHSDYNSLQCKVCEETFVWPSLLRSHKCIRLKHQEMPFQDARPEIHFDNLHEISQNGFDDFNISENDDYMNSIDFELPAPIVELTEYGNVTLEQDKLETLNNLGYKLVMQEVPIEF